MYGIDGFQGWFDPRLLEQMGGLIARRDHYRLNQYPLAESPRLLGTALQRRVWLKKKFNRLPPRYFLRFLYHWLWLGAWRADWIGYARARPRVGVMRLIEYKRRDRDYRALAGKAVLRAGQARRARSTFRMKIY